jgi:Apea-like HEPN
MEKLKESLNDIAHAIQQLINNPMDGVPITPDYELYHHWEWEKFAYSETGIDSGPGSSTFSEEAVWHRVIMRLAEILDDSTTYKKALEVLAGNTQSVADPGHALLKFTTKVIETYLTSEADKQDQNVKEVIERFIHQFTTGELNAHAVVYLVGLTLESPSIQLSPQVNLRQTSSSDIGIPTPIFPDLYLDELPFPTAVLDIKAVVLYGQNSILPVQQAKSITILKLFAVSEVYIKYTTTGTDSLMSGVWTENTYKSATNLSESTPPNFYVTKEHEPKLAAFFNYMQTHMPNLIGLNRKTDHLSVSFDRYTDACTKSGTFERKVMNAIMGLEALYLNENMELSYKLAMRCSKTMSLCGLDPLETKRTIKAGYAIRSIFAHGAYLTKRDMEKYDKQFNGYSTIATRLCNYLRITICASIICNLKKDSFLDSLDNALLSEAESTMLYEEFLHLQQYLVP